LCTRIRIAMSSGRSSRTPRTRRNSGPRRTRPCRSARTPDRVPRRRFSSTSHAYGNSACGYL
jgi:hypothetical protein